MSWICRSHCGRPSSWLMIFSLLCLSALFCDVTFSCPVECECRDNVVTCSNRGLTYVPRNIPVATERLNLQRNNISQIRRTDFSGLLNLRKLQINENRISFVHARAFDDLASLRTLLLDNNQLYCIHADTFAALPGLEVLTLNNNRLTNLIDGTLRVQNNLRTFRMHSNPLLCDCHMTWLVQWLQLHSNMAVFTQCHEPMALRGVNLAASPSAEFRCNELTVSSRPSCDQLSCPTECSCSDGVADCRDRGLTVFPSTFPSDVTEIRLEQNSIEVIPSRAFASYTNLRRIDISNNEIHTIEADAFQGLTQLTSLVLYSNKIGLLPEGIFRDLENLQLLLLNANKLKCLREDVFRGLSSLTLLSLYDNKLQSLTRGTFNSLRSIETLHLAQNPFICDCNMRWIAKYLRKHPIETSGARCAGPRRLNGRKIGQLKSRRYRCSSGYTGPHLSSQCVPKVECPGNCRCEGLVVDCSGQRLTAIPDNIPPYVAELILSNNRIKVISRPTVFRKLRNLKKIDLSNNQLRKIEDASFDGASSVVTLWLNNNLLSDVRGTMFTGLDNLKSLMLRNNMLTCIGNHTFQGLSTVTHLSLYSNQVATVLSGAFRTMTSLRTLNLLSNRLDCSCHLAWLRNWLRRSPVSSGNPRCEKPRFLRGLPVADINPQDFICPPRSTGSQSEPTCLPVRKCPTGCACQGTIVRCGSRGLRSIPIDDLPHDVTELYLEMNEIEKIPASIKQFVYLTTLDLSNNQISSLSGWMFSNLTHLSTLILSYNRLRCIPAHTFSGLRSLRILSLHSNDISALPEGLFDDLVSLSNVGFGANPWYCDCSLRWFARWVKSGNLEAGIARCSGPRRMEGRLILASTLEDFVCQGPLDISIAAKCNPCLLSPCQHNSSCSIHATDYYQCSCQLGFKGKHCEMAVDPCVLRPCQNGARCRSRDEQVYTCQCLPGFEGLNCETNVDDCASNPCPVSNATCVDGINGFTCQCPTGWEGDNCDERIWDLCASLHPCRNGGSCIPIQEIDSVSYRCECPSGYSGVNCSQRYEPCLNHKCENGGRCQVNEGSPTGYRCNCQGDYSGPYCSLALGRVVVVNNFLQDDPCTQHDCQNGAQCHTTSGHSDYQCRCLIGYHGARCEKLYGLSFHRNGSYVEMTSSLGGQRNTNITLLISTTHTDGVFLYNGDTKRSREHLAIELYSGHVRLSFDFGQFPGSFVYSRTAVNDGDTHKVEVLVRDQMVSLRIDNRDPIVESTGPGRLGMLDVEAPLHLGGLSRDLAIEARRMWHIRNASTFIGCINGFYLNDVKANFASVLPSGDNVTRDVRPGCMREGYSGSCAAARCDQGQCAFESGLGFACRCEEGYTGDRCERRDASRSSCQQHRCRHGSCVEGDGSDYTCRCQTGYSGKYCTEANQCAGVSCGKGRCIVTSSGYRCKCKRNYGGPRCQKRIRSCPGRKVKEFHRTVRTSATSGGTITCRSRRRVSNMICSGTCPKRKLRRGNAFNQSHGAPSSCCRPIRTTSKRIRMVCSDGSEHRQTMRRVRRCGCVTSNTCT